MSRRKVVELSVQSLLGLQTSLFERVRTHRFLGPFPDTLFLCSFNSPLFAFLERLDDEQAFLSVSGHIVFWDPFRTRYSYSVLTHLCSLLLNDCMTNALLVKNSKVFIQQQCCECGRSKTRLGNVSDKRFDEHGWS